MDFSGPLQNVLVQQSTTNYITVTTYSVSDPLFGTRQGSDTNGEVNSIPVNSGGVVAWFHTPRHTGYVEYRIYDPGRSNWMAGSTVVNTGGVNGPLNDSGLVAWDAGYVGVAVYDPIAGIWKTASYLGAAYSLINSGGLVAWNDDTTVYCVTFDPLTRSWKQGTFFTTPGFIPGLTSQTVNSGVVAWQASNQVYMTTYDVSRAAWRSTNVGSTGVVSGLTVANSTVSWSSDSLNYSMGYNATDGTWAAGSTPPHAAFLVSTASGNPPLFVWFTDLSLGGTGWSWNFGDGASATGRTPYHVFNGLGRYPVVQTVAGVTGTSTASTNVKTDLVSPVGSITINNGNPYTSSTNVILALSATDNSGTVSSMRFNNNYPDAASWNPWAPYAASIPWTLSSGDGLKRVYAQFSDPASNILTVRASITLDSLSPQISSPTWNTATFRATLSGPAGRNYAIDVINSLSDTPVWVEIKRVTNTTGTVEFIDPSATTPQRFYRARQTN